MSLLQRIFGGRPTETDLYQKVRADVHSHLIPGIDDGSSSMEESLVMMRALHELGYRKLITTPHVMSDAYKNTPERIQQGLNDLREAVASEGLDLELEAAAEYYLDDGFSQKLGERELLTFGGKNKYLLVETSYVARPMNLNEVIFQLNTMGYSPVLAHPERYQYFWDDNAVDSIRELRQRGMKMQVNIGSFAGRYSKSAAIIARNLAHEGLIDLIGSDLHRPQQLETIGKAFLGSKELRALVESGRLLNATL
jgi:protein-tyrosine phosphatase